MACDSFLQRILDEWRKLTRKEEGKMENVEKILRDTLILIWQGEDKRRVKELIEEALNMLKEDMEEGDKEIDDAVERLFKFAEKAKCSSPTFSREEIYKERILLIQKEVKDD